MLGLNIEFDSFNFKSVYRWLSYKDSKNNKYWNHYFNKYESKYLNNKFYLDFLKNHIRDDFAIKTKVEINLTDSLKIGSSTSKQVRKVFGKPLFTFSKKIAKEKIMVYLYKLKLLNHKAIVELHFFRNKLYFFTYNFLNANDVERKEIIRKASFKYLIEVNKLLMDEFYIVDAKHNCIIFKEDVEFSVSYFSLNKNEAYRFFSELILKESFLESKKMSYKEKMFYKLI